MYKRQILKNAFLAGFKCSESGWNLQKTENWFDKTYSFEQPEIQMPTEEEIETFFIKEHYHYQKGRYTKVDKDRIYGAKWAINEIIKRNE